MRALLLLAILEVCSGYKCGTSYSFSNKASCKDCPEKDCKMSGTGISDITCYWNDYKESCQSGKGCIAIKNNNNLYFTPDLKVKCSKSDFASSCASCKNRRAVSSFWGPISAKEKCGGECHWMEEVNICVHNSGNSKN